MTGQRTAVFGVFSAGSQAEKAVGRLTSAGFSNADISLLESTVDRLLEGLETPQRFETHAKEGDLLLLVHCFDELEIDRANTILEQNGADRIFSTGEIPVTSHGVKKP